MDALGGEHVRLDQLAERRQRGGAGADVIGHGRQRQLDPLARILLALAIERLMVGVLRDQHHRQQARSSEAARDRMEGRRRLGDRLARPAAELLAHKFGHQPLPRHHIERLGDVFADLRQLAAAAARTAGRRRVDDAPARQVLGKVPTRRRAPREAFNPNTVRLRSRPLLRRRRRQLLELQLQLVEQTLAALGARPVKLAPKLGDQQLLMRDQRLGARQFGACLNQRHLQCIRIVKVIGALAHAHHCSTSR